MFQVYVIRSMTTGQIYVGLTANLQKRLFRHNAGHNISTKLKKPWKLVFSETYPNRFEARRREKF
ncbi:MAG: GIY-YIG nuclease family protein [Elusimicrobiota bacterium]